MSVRDTRNSESRQDLQDFSGFTPNHNILKNPVNPVYFPQERINADHPEE
jgi:hypothetical protein